MITTHPDWHNGKEGERLSQLSECRLEAIRVECTDKHLRLVIFALITLIFLPILVIFILNLIIIISVIAIIPIVVIIIVIITVISVQIIIVVEVGCFCSTV